MTGTNSDSTAKIDQSFLQILEELLERNDNITARAVARLHPHIGHASTITRNSARSAILAEYQEKQSEIRKYLGRQTKRSKEAIAAELTSKDQRIAELEKQLDILRASHIAMIRAIGEMGGMGKWMKFFEHFKDVRDELTKLGAMPEGL